MKLSDNLFDIELELRQSRCTGTRHSVYVLRTLAPTKPFEQSSSPHRHSGFPKLFVISWIGVHLVYICFNVIGNIADLSLSSTAILNI